MNNEEEISTEKLDEPATSFQISRIAKEVERLLASPSIPEAAKEALRNHELIVRVLGKRGDSHAG